MNHDKCVPPPIWLVTGFTFGLLASFGITGHMLIKGIALVISGAILGYYVRYLLHRTKRQDNDGIVKMALTIAFVMALTIIYFATWWLIGDLAKGVRVYLDRLLPVSIAFLFFWWLHVLDAPGFKDPRGGG